MWPARDNDRAVLVCDDTPRDFEGGARRAACDTLSPCPEFASACERACAGGGPFQVAAPSVVCLPRCVLAAARVVYVCVESGPHELEHLRRRFRPGAGRLAVTRGEGWVEVRAPGRGAFGDLIDNVHWKTDSM
jgi:hypothetical protein